ncbi:MAG TPA: hypothetical protein VGM88_13035 [Kofleriaceae bacterium]|jgi:hypothetical protein
MWPLTWSLPSLWLALYLLSFALHAVFVSYVAAGTGYVLVSRDRDPLAARVRDWLPFMLGAGITAGVGPLLFLQLLYQHRFYTANLLMGPRWGAVVPALVVGFYALYLAKAGTWRRIALAVGLGCFAFVAWSWTELHQLMLSDDRWRTLYEQGTRVTSTAAVVPRLAMWFGVMLALFAVIAAWQTEARRRIAVLALVGIAIAAVAGFAAGSPTAAHGWMHVLVVAIAVAVVGWGLVVRRPDGIGLSLATGATTAALLAGAVVREAPRLAAFTEPVRADAAAAGGAVLFVATLALGIALIAWVARAIRREIS